jgi:hypothetical protein
MDGGRRRHVREEQAATLATTVRKFVLTQATGAAAAADRPAASAPAGKAGTQVAKVPPRSAPVRLVRERPSAAEAPAPKSSDGKWTDF